MADDLNVTESDRVKYEKIQKAKAFEEKVNKAVESIPTIQETVTELKEKLCEGDDCLEKRVERQFGEINDKVKDIQDNLQYFVCDNCGFDKVRPLSSYCPNCGSPIESWDDEDGRPVSKGWEPYWKTHPKPDEK